MDRLLLVLTLAVAPVLLFPLKFQFQLPLVAVTVPLLWLVRWPVSGRLLPSTPLNLPLAILGISVLSSVFLTPNPHRSQGKLAGAALGFLFFFALVEFLKNERRIRMAVLVFAGGGGLFVLLSLTITDWKPFYGPIGRLAEAVFPVRFLIPGFDGGFNTNPIGGSLCLFLPVLLMLWILGFRKTDLGVPGPQKLYYLFSKTSLVVVALVVLLSQSRSSWIAVLVSLTILFFSLKLLPRSQGVWRVTLGALFLLVVFGGMIFIGVVASENFTPGVMSEFSRQEVWTRAIWGIQDFPVTGLGLDVFREVVGRLFPFYRLLPGTDVASAHNQFLQAAVELGIPAMIMYGAVWCVSFRMLFLLVRSSRTPLFRDLAIGLGAGLIGHFTFQLADAVPLGAKLGVFWWFAIALITSMYCLEFSRGSGTEKKLRIRSPLLYWATGSLASVALVSQFPIPALLIALTASIAVGFAIVKEPEPKNASDSRKGNSKGWPLSPHRMGIVACIVLSLLALPGFSRAVRTNSVALHSLKDPEKLIGDVRIEKEAGVELLRALANAHWQLGNDNAAARLFSQSISDGVRRSATLFKAILATARTGDVKEAGKTLERYRFPMSRLASFAYNANIGQDQVDAIASVKVILASEQPDGYSLCTAKSIYVRLSLLDSVRPGFMGQIEQLDRSDPLDDECSIELGWIGFDSGDLPLAHSFWDPVLAREPEDQPLAVRTQSCYVTYRLASYHSKLGNAEATDAYREKGRNWCAQVGTWYSRRMLPDQGEQPD